MNPVLIGLRATEKRRQQAQKANIMLLPHARYAIRIKKLRPISNVFFARFRTTIQSGAGL